MPKNVTSGGFSVLFSVAVLITIIISEHGPAFTVDAAATPAAA